MIIQRGGIDFLNYQLGNSGATTNTYRISLENVNATFTGAGGSTTEVTLGPDQTESLRIRVVPVEGLTGKNNLRIVSENLETGITKTSEMPVRVRQKPGVTEVPVPGIGLLHLMLLALTASILYFLRI